jgi:hypothetical protein
MLRDLNLCRGKDRGYRALMGRMFRRVSGLLLACAAVMAAPSVADAAPTGSVAGWHSPVAGLMTDLTVWANPDDVALQSASVTLGGVAFPAAPFRNRNNCEGLCPVEATFDDVDTTLVPDGMRELVVTLLDADGLTHRLRLPQEPLMLTVDNAPRISPCEMRDLSCVVTVQIGSGNISPQPSPPGGGPGDPGAGPVCVSPRLSMRLDQKPLRYRRGVPVLAAGRTYRFAGRLTCRIDGRRRPAPRGTKVQLRNRVRGSTIYKPSLELRKAGDVVARLAYRSSRVVIFRVVGAGGEVVRVRIPIRVVRVKKGRR